MILPDYAEGADPRFDAVLKFTLSWEGGHSDSPADPGGDTMRGVTQGVYDRYRRARDLPARPVEQMTDDELRKIYYYWYWRPVHGTELPRPADAVVFDMAVNMGCGAAIEALCGVVGLEARSMWTLTLGDAITTYSAEHGALALCTALLLRRRERYEALVRQDPAKQIFLLGWDNRLRDLRREIQPLGQLA